MTVAPGATINPDFETGLTGLVGTIKLGIQNAAGTLVQALASANIIEAPTGSGIYVATRTAPTTKGDYILIWSLDGTTDPDQVATDDLTVTSSTSIPVEPSARDLCALADVYRYVPGYNPDDAINQDTNDTLAALITAESRGIYRDTAREFVAIPDSDPRTFDLNASIVARRALPIGDAADITQVELFDYDGVTSLGVIDAGLYTLLPRIREEWEPLTRIRFPYRPGGLVRLAPGRTLALTGTWGFPSVPDDIREACAKLVVVRYFTDNAHAGTDLSDALDPTFSVSGLTRSALEAVEGYADAGFA